MASRAVRQPSSLSGGRMEAGRRGAARGGLPGSQRLTAAAVFAAATGIARLGAARPDLTARLGRAVLPVMTRLLRGSSSGPQQPSARDKVNMLLPPHCRRRCRHHRWDYATNPLESSQTFRFVHTIAHCPACRAS